jgi:cytochrome b
MSLQGAPRTVLVWDWPVRIFHVLLGLSVLGAIGVALTVSGRSPLFPLHMLLGSIAAFLVVLRVVWGFVGSTYARFRSFLFGPKKIFDYFRAGLSRRGERWLGHNPGSSAAIFAILALVLGAATTGALATSMPIARKLHPVFAYTLLGMAAAHVVGVIWHVVRHRENLPMSMVDGKKAPASSAPGGAIRSSYPIAAMFLVALVGMFGAGAYASYDASTRSVAIPIVGKSLQLQRLRKPAPADATRSSSMSPAARS